MTSRAHVSCGIGNHHVLGLVLIVASILTCAHAAILCQAQVHDNGWYWPVDDGDTGDNYTWGDYNPAYGYHLALDLVADSGNEVHAIARVPVEDSNLL